jgi:hypothetical protein
LTVSGPLSIEAPAVNFFRHGPADLNVPILIIRQENVPRFTHASSPIKIACVDAIRPVVGQASRRMNFS